MDKDYLINLINAAYPRQPNTAPNADAITEIENYLKDQNSIPELLTFLSSEEIEDELIKKACLLFLFQSLKNNLPNEIDDNVQDWIQILFAIYQAETNFQFLDSIHRMIKLFIYALPKEEEIASIFMNFLFTLFQNDQFDHSILLGKTILTNYKPKLNPENFKIFSAIALRTFQDFPINFFDAEHDAAEIEQILTLILKSKSMLSYIYSLKAQEILEATSHKKLVFGFSVYFLPIEVLISIARLGVLADELPSRLYDRFWYFLSNSLNEFNNACKFLMDYGTEVQQELIQLIMPPNIDLTLENFKNFEDVYFNCSYEIFKSREVNEYVKSVPFNCFSQYVLNFDQKRSHTQFQCELYLTFTEILKNYTYYNSIRKFNSAFKQFLMNYHNKKEVYEYFKSTLFERFLKQYPQYQHIIYIMIMLYLSTAVTLVPNIVADDLEYVSKLIEICINSKEEPLIFHALKLLNKMIKNGSIEIFQLFVDCISHFLPHVQRFILCGEKPIVLKSLEIYSSYLNLSDALDIEFIRENAEAIKEISCQHYYQFLSFYYEKTDVHESEELEKFISEANYLLDQPFIQMNIVDLSVYLSILDFVISCLKNNERYYDEIWPAISSHFHFFVEEVLSQMIDNENKVFNSDYYSDNWFYILHIASSIASFAAFFCSDSSKVYCNQENNDFLLECVSNVWTFILYILKEKTLSLKNYNEIQVYLQLNVYAFQEFGPSFSLMNDQQMLEFFYQLDEIKEEYTDQDRCLNYVYVFFIVNSIFPRLIESNDERIYSFLMSCVSNYLYFINLFLIDKVNNYLSYIPVILEPIFEFLPQYCELNPENEPAKNLLNFIYNETRKFLLASIDTENIDEIDPFTKVSYSYFSYFNDIIEALVSVSEFSDSDFWINLYLKTCEKYSENYLYYAVDTFIKAVQNKSINDEIANEIANFIIVQLQALVSQPSSKYILTVQNIIFLFHRLIKMYQSQIILDFLSSSLALILEIPKIFLEKSEDDTQISWLKENIASLCLCLACYEVEIDPDILTESVSFFIPSDQSEIENFLNYFLFIMDQENNSQYFKILSQPIFVALINFFSKPFWVQFKFKIPKSTTDQVVALFLNIISDEQAAAFMEEFLKDKPLESFRIKKFIQFYESSSELQNENNHHEEEEKS